MINSEAPAHPLPPAPKVIHILSRPRMAYMTYHVPYAVISITTPGDGEAAVAPSDQCRAVLRLSFRDVRADECRAEWDTFLPEHARSLWAFVAEHWEHVEALVIHCDAGLSRSPAVATALDKVLNGDDSRWWEGYRFNPLVYETLLTVCPLRQGLTPPGLFDRTFGSLRGDPLRAAESG